MTEITTSHKTPGASCWKRAGTIFWKLSLVLFLPSVMFLFSGCAAGTRATDFELVPVTDAPSGIHSPGKFVWNDLLTDDVPTAKRFYGQLFGWTFETSGNYSVIKNQGRNIGGIAHIKKDADHPSVSRWLCTLSVADLDRAVALIKEEGGVVNEGPVDLDNRGRGALVRDPLGAQLMLLYTVGGDPEDEEPVIGSWLWHELWSNQVNESLVFYQKLAGYDFTGDPADYLILTRDEEWRAGIRHVENRDLELRWVPVVRVADTEAVADRASQLGGQVLVEPRATDDGGSVALLADPSHALLIIQRWTAPVSEQENGS